MLVVSPSAMSRIRSLLSNSGVPDGVINIVAESRPIVPDEDLLNAIRAGNAAALKKSAQEMANRPIDMLLTPTVVPRGKFSPLDLVEIDGVTFCIPSYIPRHVELRVDVVDGKFTFTDANGVAILGF